MSLFRTKGSVSHRPEDSPDLSWMMSFVTTVGGISAYTSKRSRAGLVVGCGLGVLFGCSGAMIGSDKAETHELAHQMALLGSVMFGGAMGYRAGANPYVGPGGAMLAALGGLSSAYHLTKWLEWRSYEAARVEEAERLLRDHYKTLSYGAGPKGAAAAAAPEPGAAAPVPMPAPRRPTLWGASDGPSLPPGGR